MTAHHATAHHSPWWWPWTKDKQASKSATRGVYVDWNELVALEFAARRVRWPPQSASARSLLAGRHRSRVRGRGLDFIELRQYLPGDDTRSIDWRASARTGKTQVRVFAEERDRPTWLLVDQRISMFFARTGALRSVLAAEAAAVWAWRALSGGDRVGGLVIADDSIDEMTPRRGRAPVLQLLRRITERNHGLHAALTPASGTSQLDAALLRLAHHAPREAVIAVFSDFEGLGDASTHHLLALARHNDLVLLPIWDDPGTTTAGVQLVVTNGSLQLPIAHEGNVARKLSYIAQERRTRLLKLRCELGCAVFPLRTSESALLQLAQGMDSPPQPRR